MSKGRGSVDIGITSISKDGSSSTWTRIGSYQPLSCLGAHLPIFLPYPLFPYPADELRYKSLLTVWSEVIRVISKLLSNLKSKKGSDSQRLCHEYRFFDSDVLRSYIWELILDHAHIFYGDQEGKKLWLYASTLEDYTNNVPRDRPEAEAYYQGPDLQSAMLAGWGEFDWSGDWEIDKWE